ncbi:MAG: hypothetical protein L3J21_03145 [Devosiaceae bacterium]|nr:hypothetical protein [Devosiaceae bacterium]
MLKNILIFGFMLLAIIGAAAPSNAQISSAPQFQQPFSSSSVWRRPIPRNATYFDVSDAIWGEPSLAPNRVSIEQITIIYVDENQPEVNIVKSRGWFMPKRAQTDGQVFYTRRFAPDTGINVRYPSTANASFVIIDPKTSLATEGSAGWRDPGGDLITFYDEPRVHNIDLKGDGLFGTLGSGLPALGGLIRAGEINNGINHSIAIAMGSSRFSKTNHFVAPAWRADGFSSSIFNGYLGTNPRYTMGTLLAIPYSINIDAIEWNTPQGYILAKSSQQYGWIIVDSGDGGLGDDQMKLNTSRIAAVNDFGVLVNPDTDELYVGEAKFDVVGLEKDVIAIMKLVMATTK